MMRKGYGKGFSTRSQHQEMGVESRVAHAPMPSFFADLFFVLLFPSFFRYHYCLALLLGAVVPISLVAAPPMAVF